MGENWEEPVVLDESGGRGRTLVRREEKALFCLGMVATYKVIVI